MMSKQLEASLYMTGQGEKSSSSASAVQNVQFALSHSVISDYIYCPMISYRPLKNKKKSNALAMEAKRQSLCTDVIFQGNDS